MRYIKEFKSEPESTKGIVMSTPGIVEPENGNAIPEASGMVIPLDGKHADEPEEMSNPEVRSIYHHMPRNALKKLLVGWLIKRRNRQLDPDELAKLEEKKRREELEKLLRDEASLYKQRIINRLNGRNLCYRYKKSEKDFLLSGVQSVKFDYVVMQPDAIYLRIDTMRLPRGVGILDLMNEDVLTDLSIACGHRVTADYSDVYGAWYIVERAAGALGIPVHVRYQDVLSAMPPSADSLTIPLGVTTNGKHVYKSLSSMYSMLIGGTIGAGKSNILNVILTTLIRRNNPKQLRLLLVDLKGGLEFSFYENIPHLLPVDDAAPGGIAYYREQVPQVLKYLVAEGERRIEIMRKAGYKDIGRYNQFNRKHALAHILFVVDEWADIKLDKNGRESEELLINIAQRFRAVGIHVILCTQIPKSEVVSTRIKGVLPAKLAFSVPTNQASMSIIDNGHARGLPTGRCVFQWTSDEILVQTPYINEKIIKDTVSGVISGELHDVDQGHDVTPDEIAMWAIENDSGWLSIRRVYEQFHHRGISRNEIEDLFKSWENQEIVVGTSLYKVVPASGTRPRRLVAVADDEEKQ